MSSYDDIADYYSHLENDINEYFNLLEKNISTSEEDEMVKYGHLCLSSLGAQNIIFKHKIMYQGADISLQNLKYHLTPTRVFNILKSLPIKSAREILARLDCSPYDYEELCYSLELSDCNRFKGVFQNIIFSDNFSRRVSVLHLFEDIKNNIKVMFDGEITDDEYEMRCEAHEDYSYQFKNAIFEEDNPINKYINDPFIIERSKNPEHFILFIVYLYMHLAKLICQHLKRHEIELIQKYVFKRVHQKIGGQIYALFFSFFKDQHESYKNFTEFSRDFFPYYNELPSFDRSVIHLLITFRKNFPQAYVRSKECVEEDLKFIDEKEYVKSISYLIKKTFNEKQEDNNSVSTEDTTNDLNCDTQFSEEEYQKFTFEKQKIVFTRRDLSLSQILYLYKALIKEGCIPEITDFNMFVYRITGKLIPGFTSKEKIVWEKGLETLVYFVHRLNDGISQSSPWKLTAVCFKNESGADIKVNSLKTSFNRIKNNKIDKDGRLVKGNVSQDFIQLQTIFDKLQQN